MKKISLITLCILVLALPLVHAEESVEPDFSIFIETLGQEMQGQELPEPLNSFLGDQRINIHITQTDDEEIIAGVVIEKNIFKQVVLAEVKEPTLNVYTTKETFQGLMDAEDQKEYFTTALKEGKISYKAVGLKNKMKFAFASLIARISSSFKKEKTSNIEIIPKEKIEKQKKTAEKITASIVADINKEKDTESKKEEVEESKASEKQLEDDSLHIVELIDGGFQMNQLTINVGDTVEWKNVRTNQQYKKALIVGSQKCGKVKSGIYFPGESFKWTFNEPLSCLIVDGIYTTQTMKLTVK